ncbi:MAG: hypothetical protein ABSF92_05125 [Candidatus Acidiferrales bacterium]|jgi:tetrahydromethanopterin S-methyltransferase subunit E
MTKLLLVLGAVLLLAGVAALIHPTFTYTKKDEVLKIGTIQATVQRQESVQIPTGVAVLGVIAGLGLAVISFQLKK